MEINENPKTLARSRSKSLPKRKTEVDEFYRALMSEVGPASEAELVEGHATPDLSKTEELFEADLVAMENSINAPGFILLCYGDNPNDYFVIFVH